MDVAGAGEAVAASRSLAGERNAVPDDDVPNDAVRKGGRAKETVAREAATRIVVAKPVVRERCIRWSPEYFVTEFIRTRICLPENSRRQKILVA